MSHYKLVKINYMTYDSDFYSGFKARMANKLREENRKDQVEEQTAINETYDNLEAGQTVNVATTPLNKLTPPFRKFTEAESLEEIAR